MKNFILIIIALVQINSMMGQLSCTNATVRTLTAYTNGAQNDSLFYICTGQTGTLVATPPSGVPGWNFAWQVFNATSNSWTFLTTQNNVATSTQTNLVPGGYRVQITDGNAEVVGTFIAWIVRINSNPSVDVSPITPGCSSLFLIGSISNGAITPYYNPPSAGVDPNSAMIINSSTSINICFSGNHTWVSDLAFYVQGPASCGSPIVLLSPNPGAIGQGAVCNSGNNISNLCFSTSSSNAINICTATTPLSGTYGAYGPGATPINWAPLYGCDASLPGWTVQIYDCIGGDVGSLTAASLSFTGTTVGGNTATYNYSTPSGFNSVINDNSCSPSTASIFTVSAPPATPINATYGYQWSANPPFPIPNSTSSLFIPLNPGPSVDTEFTLTLTGNNPGAPCGGVTSDTELYDFLSAGNSSIEPINEFYCELDEPFTLVADVAGGTWSGTGIVDASLGIFDPSVAGEGLWTITYTPPGECVSSATTQIAVVNQDIVSITNATACAGDEEFLLQVNSNLGQWSGNGIIDPAAGLFDPAVAGPGISEIVYSFGTQCVSSDTLYLEVFETGLATIEPVGEQCPEAPSFDLVTSIPGGTWSGTGITEPTLGTFDPSVAGLGSWEVTYLPNVNCAVPSSITIVVSEQVTANITQAGPFCSNDAAVNLVVDQTGGIWSGPGITNAETGTFNPSQAGAGIHAITYFIEGACDVTGTINIEVIQLPVINITAPSQICIDANPVNITSGASGGTWSGPGINPNTGVFNPQTAGAGNASITYTITGVCDVSASAQITVNPLPNVQAGNNVSICAGNSTTLSATGAASYSWSPSNGLSSTSVASPTASPSGTTTYVVTGTSAAGCISSDDVVVTVNPNPVVVVNGPFTICEGDEIQLSANGLNTYLWTPANLVSNLNASNPTASPMNDQVFTVEGVSAAGCPGSATVNVNVIEMSITSSPASGIAPLEVFFTNASEGGNFFWNFGDGSSYTSENLNDWPTHTFQTDGSFETILSSTLNGTTCFDTLVTNVFLESQIIKIPNVITANGRDGNETFRIVSENIKTLEILIFNRWGNEVGKIINTSGGWAPEDNGAGTYFYVLKATGFDGKQYEREGSFTVITE